MFPTIDEYMKHIIRGQIETITFHSFGSLAVLHVAQSVFEHQLNK